MHETEEMPRSAQAVHKALTSYAVDTRIARHVCTGSLSSAFRGPTQPKIARVITCVLSLATGTSALTGAALVALAEYVV